MIQTPKNLGSYITVIIIIINIIINTTSEWSALLVHIWLDYSSEKEEAQASPLNQFLFILLIVVLSWLMFDLPNPWHISKTCQH